MTTERSKHDTDNPIEKRYYSDFIAHFGEEHDTKEAKLAYCAGVAQGTSAALAVLRTVGVETTADQRLAALLTTAAAGVAAAATVIDDPEMLAELKKEFLQHAKEGAEK